MAKKTEIKAIVSAETKGFKQGMNDVGKGLGMASTKFAKMGAAASAGFLAVGVAAATAGVALMAGFAVMAAKAFIQFEDQMVKTAAIMGKTGTQDISKLNDEVLRLGATTRSSAVDVAQAAQILALAGLGETEMVDDKALENLNAFAIAAGVDMPTAAGVAIATIKGMRMEVSQMREATDILMNTMTQTFTDINSLGEAMKFLGPTASAAGISLSEAAAAAGILGNAGLQGSMAGTAMRMAITKLLKPTDDARKMMDAMGLSFTTLSPIGESAKAALAGVNASLERTRLEADASNASMKALNDELADLSMDQQRNSIAIMQIKRRAEKEGRELTEREISQIDRLEGANDDLQISMMERRLEQQQMQKENDRLNDSVKTQESEAKSLNKTMNEQTTGITSLADVFNQLTAAGATTTQILEIFGVRGGTAINAILAQNDAFGALIESNKTASDQFDGLGKTQGMVATMTTSTANAMFELKSAFDAFFIKAGAELAPVLREEVVPALIEMLDAFTPMIPQMMEFFKVVLENLPIFIDAFIPIMEMTIITLTVLAPILRLIALLFKGIFIVIEPVITVINDLLTAIADLFEGDWEGFADGVEKAFLGLFNVLDGVFGLIGGILDSVGLGGVADAAADANEATGGKLGKVAGGAAAGAAIGSVVPGVGTAVGAVIGGGIGLFMADGGIVEEATPAIIGEAGPEAVIPLNKLGGLVAQGVREAGGGGRDSIVINGGIHIGAGNNITARQVEEIIKRGLPQALRSANRTSSRSVI
jgi:TP901 family phage tail tape measure protein